MASELHTKRISVFKNRGKDEEVRILNFMFHRYNLPFYNSVMKEVVAMYLITVFEIRTNISLCSAVGLLKFLTNGFLNNI